MKDIKELLKKYISLDLENRELIEFFIDFLLQKYQISLIKKDFKVDGKTIRLQNKNPKEKTFILINKTAIISALNNRGFVIEDII